MIRNDEPSLKEFFPVCFKENYFAYCLSRTEIVPMYSHQEFVKINVEELFLEG